ncbi:MAG: polysaccharide biosynthesis tyrosine autokinase [Desulfobacteraceae bacterium]|jgi:non-specific protein-tyrosine kinase|nr:polysaccharide biosynthesis tyrosine autokinase [Desulfobacteraceae bacterium]
MKLRKALDRAKLAREGLVPASLVENKKIKEIKPPKEWRPPLYSKSTRIALNRNTVLDNRCVCIEPNSPEIDCYKVLRTKIQLITREEGWNTVMITSPRPAEGKTLTAINLALTFSKVYNQTVLLVDCDLRHQNVHKLLGFQSDSGLMNYLLKGQPLEELIIWPGVDKLTLISGGQTLDNSSELIGSPQMKILIQEMKSRYEDRYVIFDTAPLLIGDDAIALAHYIDSIIMVVEEGRTSIKDVKKAIEMLPQEKFLGFVLNRQTGALADRYYGYYKGHR